MSEENERKGKNESFSIDKKNTTNNNIHQVCVNVFLPLKSSIASYSVANMQFQKGSYVCSLI